MLALVGSPFLYGPSSPRQHRNKNLDTHHENAEWLRNIWPWRLVSISLVVYENSMGGGFEMIRHHGYPILPLRKPVPMSVRRASHLFWTLETTERWILPNGACYVLLVSSVVYVGDVKAWGVFVYCLFFQWWRSCFISREV